MRNLSRFALVVGLTLLTIGAVTHAPQLASAAADFYTRVQVFQRMLQIIDQYYVEDVDVDELFDNAIGGVLENLDPHTRYYTAEQFRELQEDYRGDYAGIGIAFELLDFESSDRVITVLQSLEGGPSAALGLKPGDQIIGINGEDATNTTVEEVYTKLRGPRGTQVNVTVRRPRLDEELEYTIVRDRVDIAAVTVSTMVAPDIGYVRLSTFSQKAADQLEAALQQLENQGMQRLILDLRGNGGGLMSQALRVADKFLDGGQTILETRGRTPNSNSETTSTDRDTHPRMPMIVLVNRGSASASEIVSGALQDWDRALIVGETTFGKGLVQNQFKFKDDSALFLTIARYYTPSGRLIQRQYKGKDIEEYLNPDIWEAEDPVPGSPDSEREAPSTDVEERPVFQTAAGRMVYGGGGIHPDVEIDPTRVSGLAAAFYRAPFRRTFQFGIEYAATHGAAQPRDFDDYLANFEITAALVDEFVEFLRRPHIRRRLEEANVPLTDEALQGALEDLRIYLKADIAANLWGQERGREILLRHDDQVQRAIDLFPKAAELLALERKVAS